MDVRGKYSAIRLDLESVSIIFLEANDACDCNCSAWLWDTLFRFSRRRWTGQDLTEDLASLSFPLSMSCCRSLHYNYHLWNCIIGGLGWGWCPGWSHCSLQSAMWWVMSGERGEVGVERQSLSLSSVSTTPPPGPHSPPSPGLSTVAVMIIILATPLSHLQNFS